jgi:FtsH-binding integral membrane protein
MWACVICFVISVIEWFLVSKRTNAIVSNSAWVLALGTGYIVFVQQNIPALIACAVGGGMGAELARRWA